MILNTFNLEGKVALVTGCNTSLGQGMALGLAQTGCDIVGVNRDDPMETEQRVKELGRRFWSLQADLIRTERTEQVPCVVEKAVADAGKIDILVNNAGIIRCEDALNFSEQDWDDVMNINSKSVFFLSQHVARQFIAQGHGGKIINIASMLSFQGVHAFPPTPTQKARSWA
nr:4-deoxy-L-threo-5-hexosulose-uronate ketol-isomerase [Candidatus Pantoea persica]